MYSMVQQKQIKIPIQNFIRNLMRTFKDILVPNSVNIFLSILRKPKVKNWIKIHLFLWFNSIFLFLCFRDVDTNLTVDVFQPTPVMSSYLNAFVISKFGYLENSAYKSRVFARKEALDDAIYTLYITPHLLESLESLTNITYLSTGIGKLDQIAVPDFSAGAMENWGLITYR